MDRRVGGGRHREMEAQVGACMDTCMDRYLRKVGVWRPQASCLPGTGAWPGLLLSPRHSQRR